MTKLLFSMSQFLFLRRYAGKGIGFAWIGSLVLLLGCSRQIEVSPAQVGYPYFPLEVGQFAEYDLTDVTYSLSASPITVQYQVREVVRETSVDLEGQERYRIERFVRDQASQPWELDSIWSAWRTVTQAARTENNVTFVKLVFPFGESLKWNGNAFNDRGKEEYRLRNVGKPFAVNAQSFTETVTVLQSDTAANLIDQDKRWEVYAKNVGLIYAEKVVVQFCADSDCLGQRQISYGTQRTQKLIAHGKE